VDRHDGSRPPRGVVAGDQREAQAPPKKSSAGSGPPVTAAGEDDTVVR
jgi:hypothetical protein